MEKLSFISRRDLLKGGAALVVSFALVPKRAAAQNAKPLDSGSRGSLELSGILSRSGMHDLVFGRAA